jgi:hypothetical protein
MPQCDDGHQQIIEEPTMSIIPTVSARMHERFIVNYRMPMEAMVGYLPAPWLRPQEIHGYALASFCMLDLRGVIAEPLPSRVGLSMVSCAPRFAVVDHSTNPPTPAVLVTERYTNSAFGSFVTKLGFSAAHGHVGATISHRDRAAVDPAAVDPAAVDLRVTEDDGGVMFEAVVRPTLFTASPLFDSVDAFVATIAEGVRSFGVSRHVGRLTVLDLAKDDAAFEPFEALSVGGSVVNRWEADGAVLDSVFRTTNARYAWTYHGLRATAGASPIRLADMATS